LREIAKYIDWTFFFTAWELRGKYPQILDHPEQGKAARDLFDAGKKLLERMMSEKLVTARGAYGFWPAARDGEDIVLFADESRSSELARFPMLRQQQAKSAGGDDGEGGPAHLCLADYVGDLRTPDYVGAFAITAGIGVDELSDAFKKEHDDYASILAKSLADRLAEAFAEMLHARVRRAWYAPDEVLADGDILAERYRGIRPALGYPACPDHTLKGTLFRILDADKQGVHLTTSFAMTPAASVSGLYIAHPEARYFNLGKIGRDQVEDYARRTGKSLSETERWLGPNLGYEAGT
jgi:5-methyltetrahydrofolate--homocysteine methyltransferase